MIAFIDSIEAILVSLAARLGPWLAPIPPAYFIARSAQKNLHAPDWVALAVGLAVEAVGIATVHNSLVLYDYMREKRQSDPPAPLGLSLALAGVYLITGISLSVFLEAWPTLLSPYAPALFFLLAGAGYGSLAISADQSRREAEIARGKARTRERRDERQAVRLSSPQAQKKEAGGDDPLAALVSQWSEKEGVNNGK
jgi:hypothetical protein